MKEFEDRFVEIEKRVKALSADNRTLRARISELENELVRVRREAQRLDHIHGKQLHIREKIERVLQSLETVNMKD